jgi:chromosome segregation ATPase
MESEKVKKIKKALECCVDSIKYGCEGCPYHKSSSDCQELLVWDMEDYINDLESENERLQNKNYQLEQDLGQCENGYKLELHTARYQLNSANEDLRKAEKRIAELEKEIEENAFYSKGYAQGIKNTYEVIIPDKLKQFAERLKKEGFVIFMGDVVIRGSKVDEVLKEFKSEKLL